MLHTRFIVEYLWIIFQIKEALMLMSPPEMYGSLMLSCSCEIGSMIYWRRNNATITHRKGKFLIRGIYLEVLDIREYDQGVYTCGPSKSMDICDSFNVTVRAPKKFMQQLHRNTVPLNVSEELRDKIYWHPKMKRESVFRYMDFDPIILSAYFYISSNYLHPDVRWLPPIHHHPFQVGNLSSERIINCEDLEETQRSMNGTCYRASLEIRSLSNGGEFVVMIQPQSNINSSNHIEKTNASHNHLNQEISFSFFVLKNALSHFTSDDSVGATSFVHAPESLIEPDLLFADMGFKDYRVIDELKEAMESDMNHAYALNETSDTSVLFHAFDRYSAFSQSSTTQSVNSKEPDTEPSSSLLFFPNKKPELDCSVLNETSYQGFEFFAHSTQACIGANLTVDCRLFRIPVQLELWFLRPLLLGSRQEVCSDNCTNLGCFDQPQLLQTSRVQEYRIIRQASAQVDLNYQFDDNVAVTITSLRPEHSGLYMCRADAVYRTLSIEVRDCTASGRDFKPLLLILLILLITVAILALPLLICLRSRRKPMFAVLSSSMPRLDGLLGSDTKKLTVVNRTNQLYSVLFNEKTSSLLHGCKSWSSSCSESKQPLITVRVNEHITRLKRKQSRVFRPPARLMQSGSRFPYRILADPRWEIARSLIEIDQVLGQGNFGIVYRGVVRGPLHGVSPTEKSTPAEPNVLIHDVAIKTLRDDYTEEELVDLIRELETMKLLNPHPHVIQLLGACTQQGPPMIILEYAAHGNLRDFLRKHRSKCVPDQAQDYSLASASNSPDSDSSSLTAPNSVGDPPRLTVQLLLRFASHVANALTYFESLKLAHRDIAARNVVICQGYVAKLCDFGFTRVIEEYYVDANRDQFPYRWMAPECFDTNQYTLKSDIWSFGILLWELFSLGDTPYPGVSTADLPEWLAAGNRNTQPILADVTLFNLMLRCWAAEPDQRPTFQTILHELLSYPFPYGPSPMRQSSQDSGFCTASRSRQSSQQDSNATGLFDTICSESVVNCPSPTPKQTGLFDINGPVAWNKPLPPVRTCSLPGYGKSFSGYVEMRCNEYLEPRCTLNPNEIDHSPV